MFRWKSLSLSSQLLLGIAILCVLSLAVAFVVANTLVREVVHENILESNLRHRQIHAQQLDSWFSEQAHIVTAYSRVLHLIDRVYYLSILDEIVYNYELAQSFWINLYDGSMYDSNRWTPPYWWVAQERPWWQLAEAHSGEVTITLPYVSAETNRLVSTISRHIVDWGGQPGVAAMDIDLWRFEAIMNDLAALADGYLFLVGPGGEIIIHPNPAYMLGDYGFINVEDIYDYFYIIGYSPSGDTVLQINDSYFMQFPLASIGWTLVAVMPTYITSVPVWNMLWIVMMVIIFAVSIVSVFTFFYVKWVASSATRRENELLKELQDAEWKERTRLMLDVAPLLIQYWNNEYACVDCNQTSLDFYGFSTKEEYFDKLKDALPTYQEDGTPSWYKWNTFLKKVFDTGFGHTNFLENNRNGEPAYFEVEGLRTEHNNETVVITYSTDITQFREKDRFQIMLDSSPNVIVVFDKDANVIDVNQAALEFYGFESKQDYIDKFLKTTPEFQPNGVESVPFMLNFFRSVIEAGKPTVFNNWMLQSTKGEPRPIDVTAVPMKMDGKDCIIIHTVDLREHIKLKELQEIEWQRAQEDKMREIEQKAASRLQQLLDSAPISCFVLDETLCATGCNQAAVELFVKRPGEALFQTYPEMACFEECKSDCWDCGNYGRSSCRARQFLIHNNRQIFPGYETNMDAIEQMLKEGTAVALNTGVSQISEFEYLTLYGEAIPVEIIVVALRYRDGYGLAIYVRDLRETRMMQAEMIRREIAENENLAKSQFLARMSHEIRTPMNAVMGMAELILRESIPEQAREQAEIIKQSGNHLLSVINDILDLSKIESGKLELMEAEYLPASMINDLINIIKVRLPGRKLRFVLNISSNIPHALWGDSARVYQVIMNLLSNAVKYTDKGFVALDMEGERDGDAVNLIIKVRDSGKGIKEEDLSCLFEEFVRLDAEANKSIEGTGLGLAITRSLVHRMGGTIEVESTYGIGSAFTVTLPQTIKSHENMATVISPEQKPVIVFERREHAIKSINYTMNDLGVSCTIVETHEQFCNGLKSGKYAFAFVSERLYDIFCTKCSSCPTQTKIVLVNQFDDKSTTKDRGLLVITTPIYCLAVASVLNNTPADRSAARKSLHHFTAPAAKVLIVDDVQVNLKVADGLLKPYQMATTLCESGRDSIEAIKKDTFDLVLMDYMMPGMSGVEATKAMREAGARIPIIALTANAIVGAKEMFLETGFDDFLSKPIEVAFLNKILAKWIPKEKQQQADLAEVVDEARIEIHIDGVDTAKGLELSGGNDRLYMDLIATFGIECAKKLNELTRCFEAADIPLYTIHVHALKTACANIGASAVSEDAANLENAGERQDMKFIREYHDGFADNLVRLIANVNEVVAGMEKPNVVDCDDDFLIIGLTKLKTALENFDVGAIDSISKEIQDFKQHPTHGEAVREILRLVFISKYRQSGVLINKILKNQED
ncbi:MAG: ATP-binding protein [Defluviitaleaceae bacterium]|nr:ATP-binding protein [Defluviitaleaceae bacterium]